MSTKTTNLNLDKPEIGDTVSTTITQLGSNFDIIDESLAHKANKTAIYVDGYFNLKVTLGDGTFDYAPCIQAAFNDAASSSLPVVFPTSQVLQVGTPIRITAQNGAHIFGNRCILKRVGLSASSDTPIMYYLGLDVIGGTTQAYNFNGGVYIHNLKFMGIGFGSGYKHALAGELYMYNCVFDSTLEYGAILSSTNGCHFYGCQFSGSKKGLFCAKNVEDSYTVNYTSQGTGYNDGIYCDGGIFNCPYAGYGFYYSGSVSEGVFKISNMKLLGGSNNTTGIYGKGFTNMIIENCWSEYFNGGKVIWADKDNGSEADSLVVKGCQFTNHAGTYPSISDYSIYGITKRAAIDDCVFNSTPNQSHIYWSGGSTNSLRVNTSVTPNAVDTTNGTIDLPKATVPDTRDLLITDGTNNYYLMYASDQGAGGYRYNTYTYTTPIKARLREWRWGTYVDEYWLTRITNPVLSIKSYTITSPDDNSGYCEVNRAIFQGTFGPGRTKCVSWGGFGAIVAKNPMTI